MQQCDETRGAQIGTLLWGSPATAESMPFDAHTLLHDYYVVLTA